MRKRILRRVLDFRSCEVLLVHQPPGACSGIHHKELGDGQYAEGTPQARF